MSWRRWWARTAVSSSVSGRSNNGGFSSGDVVVGRDSDMLDFPFHQRERRLASRGVQEIPVPPQGMDGDAKRFKFLAQIANHHVDHLRVGLLGIIWSVGALGALGLDHAMKCGLVGFFTPH